MLKGGIVLSLDPSVGDADTVAVLKLAWDLKSGGGLAGLVRLPFVAAVEDATAHWLPKSGVPIPRLGEAGASYRPASNAVFELEEMLVRNGSSDSDIVAAVMRGENFLHPIVIGHTMRRGQGDNGSLARPDAGFP